MTTNNIISTPNITGNVGSCSTQVATVETGRDLFTINFRDIATNSCTGQTTTSDYWEFSGSTGFVSLVFGLFVVICFCTWALNRPGAYSRF